ncbi:MAG: YtxH domain-containing protein [Paramuribaculum sp.]|nr:YtxH domain-containing protein [Paramuribaculum sp.]
MAKSALYAFIGGAIVGGALGMLYAPYEGRELRRRIKRMVSSRCPAYSDEELEAIVEQITAEVTKE